MKKISILFTVLSNSSLTSGNQSIFQLSYPQKLNYLILASLKASSTAAIAKLFVRFFVYYRLIVKKFPTRRNVTETSHFFLSKLGWTGAIMQVGRSILSLYSSISRIFLMPELPWIKEFQDDSTFDPNGHTIPFRKSLLAKLCQIYDTHSSYNNSFKSDCGWKIIGWSSLEFEKSRNLHYFITLQEKENLCEC